MINRDFFFANSKSLLFNGSLKQSQVDGLNAILVEWESKYSDKDDRWLAYMLATAFHETDRQMKPIEEYGKGKHRRYGNRIKMNGQPYDDTDNIFYGRGFVQLTWYENYEKAGNELNIDLLNDPSLALDLKNASDIMFSGMIEGWFTGRKLSDYFNEDNENWIQARKIINGLDKANTIADYGRKFYSSISYTT